MLGTLEEEITLELARLQRAAYENVRKRTAAQQLGEAWVDLIPADVNEAPRKVA
jgi:hypothetical protein